MGSSTLASNRGRASGRRNHLRRNLLIAAAVIVAEIVVMRLRGYRFGVDVIVRCQKGHLFSTIWLPGGSLKSARLGWWRFQRCPVGGHWSLVTPVKVTELSDEERRIAREHKDIRVP